MQLGASQADNLAATAGEAFGRRLAVNNSRPLVVALSGGGDSLALLLLARDWAEAAGRILRVLTVDHRLNPQSGAWTRRCAETAARLGLPFQALAWDGPKPVTGLPAAARQARHSLLARAARDAGAPVILMGHTADDMLEAAQMRRDGATTPAPREWAPSPVWPEGRGLFVLRPLLALRRGQIREWLTARGETWIEDPGNQDLRFARSRARASAPQEGATDAQPAAALPGAAEVREPVPGLLSLDRDLFRQTGPNAPRLLATMAVCAGGGSRTAGANDFARATRAFQGEADATLTLSGARLEADAHQIRAMREAGEGARGGLAPLLLEPGEPTVWDGRFELEVARPGLEVRALAGRMSRLDETERGRLASVPAAARGGLPALVDPSGSVTCPIVNPLRGVGWRSLVGSRFAAAAGLIDREPA